MARHRVIGSSRDGLGEHPTVTTRRRINRDLRARAISNPESTYMQERPLRLLTRSQRGLVDTAFDRDSCGLAMVATLRRTPGHDVVVQALDALRHLEHRGAVGSDAGTGDGAGILTQIPDEFFRGVCEFALPSPGEYAAGLVFLPQEPAERERTRERIEKIARQERLRVLG